MPKAKKKPFKNKSAGAKHLSFVFDKKQLCKK